MVLMQRLKVLFLVPRDYSVDGADEWEPDENPEHFSDSTGHTLIELYRRLKPRYPDCALGAEIHKQAGVVVLGGRHFDNLSRLERVRLAFSLARHKVIIIRGDLPTKSRTLIRADIVVMPNRTSVQMAARRDSIFIPPLVQRGLLSRDKGRAGTIKTLGLKANPNNVPPYLFSGDFLASLERLGVELKIDCPSEVNGNDHYWHDFQELDLVLCARSKKNDLISKPATKLRNAWAAGSIPIVAFEPAYEEIATDEVNALFFHDEDHLLEQLERVVTDTKLQERLWTGVLEQTERMALQTTLLDEWWQMLSSERSAPSRLRAVLSIGVFLYNVSISILADTLNLRIGGRVEG